MAEHGANRSYDLPPASPAANHGKTPAGWAMLLLVTIGAAVAGLGLMMWSQWLIGAGGVVVVLGLVASRIMRAMGMGQPARSAASHGSSTGDRSPSDDWYA